MTGTEIRQDAKDNRHFICSPLELGLKQSGRPNSISIFDQRFASTVKLVIAGGIGTIRHCTPKSGTIRNETVVRRSGDPVLVIRAG